MTIRDPQVSALIDGLDDVRAARVARLRDAILAEPDVSESVKWNAPNFLHRGEDRITFRVRPDPVFQLILHRGAARTGRPRPDVDDPGGALDWKDDDRAVIDLAAVSDAHALALVRSWLSAAAG